MAVVAAGLAELAEKGLSEQVVEKAKEMLARIILPETVTRRVIEKYMRKAMQAHAWYSLNRVDRAILVLSRRLPRVKSPVLKSILHKIFLKIELCTIRGKALFYGIIVSMQNVLNRLHELLMDIPKLLTIGLFYLNNPLIYRIYG